MRTHSIGASVVAALVIACGGSQPGNAGSGYQEYVCPAPIGKIVREDCSRSALRYEGTSFEGSVGVGGVGASAAYRENAIRQADALVSMLKEQRVQLCNDFNTCKTSVAEYNADKRRLDDSYVALLTLKDRMAQLDAEGAAKILGEIQRIRTSVSAPGATASIPDSPREAARVYYEAFIAGDVDKLFNASSAKMQTGVWKSRAELRAWRDGIVDDCGPVQTNIRESYVVKGNSGTYRKLSQNARKRCETTIFVDEITRQITGWYAAMPTERVIPAFADVREAGRALYKAFIDGDTELVFDASARNMQDDVWVSYGSIALWRRGVVDGLGAEKAMITETITDSSGRDLYERIAEYQNGNKTRFRIWFNRSPRAISGWMVEPAVK